jgi:hypothetical protein
MWFELIFAAAFVALYVAFWAWHSQGAGKLSQAEIDQYLAKIENLPLPKKEIQAFIAGLRQWAEADDGKPVYMFNLMHFFPRVQPFPRAPEFTETWEISHYCQARSASGTSRSPICGQRCSIYGWISLDRPRFARTDVFQKASLLTSTGRRVATRRAGQRLQIRRLPTSECRGQIRSLFRKTRIRSSFEARHDVRIFFRNIIGVMTLDGHSIAFIQVSMRSHRIICVILYVSSIVLSISLLVRTRICRS